jgi:hypothetical protein
MIQEALKPQSSHNYVGIHPDLDFGDLSGGKNLDLVRLGYCNMDGLPAKISGNTKVNAIRRYTRKHDSMVSSA